MYINGTQFNVEVSEIIAELKSQLASNGIDMFYKTFDSGDNVMVCCPYHKHGQERRPSCGIRKSDGIVNCLACGKTVGIDEMIANCFGYSDPVWGYRWLISNFSTISVEQRADIELDLDRHSKPTVNDPYFVPVDELDSYRYIHPYMYERGLTDEIIGYFDIGYDKTTDSITFPVRYWGSLNFGRCLFVAKRNIKTKRFDLPKNIGKPLYGLYEIWGACMQQTTTELLPEVYVCEGLFDCLRLWCNGKYAVAGFGCLYSDYQLKLLEGLPTRKLILAFDNDKAGKDGADRVRRSIKNKIITEVILPDNKKDIGECTDEEIQNLNEVF